MHLGKEVRASYRLVDVQPCVVHQVLDESCELSMPVRGNKV